MSAIVQGFGLIVVVVGVLAGLVGLNAGLAGLLMGAYIVISGAVLFCFGTMVEHLAAIRKSQDEMLMEFRNIVQRMPERENVPVQSKRPTERADAPGFPKWPG